MENINRKNDDIIINTICSILSNGSFVVETMNESILCKLMELRGTPISYAKTARDIDADYAMWNDNNVSNSNQDVKNEIKYLHCLNISDVNTNLVNHKIDINSVISISEVNGNLFVWYKA